MRIHRPAPNQRERLAWLRWEFIRRNPEYQQQYEAFHAKFGLWFETNGYWWDTKGPTYNEHSWYYFCSEIAPVARSICERWQIANPYPPSWAFDHKCNRVERGSTLLIPTFGEYHRTAWLLKVPPDPSLFPDPKERFLVATKHIPKTLVGSPSWQQTGDDRYLRLEIDLADTLEEILAYVEHAVEFPKHIYMKNAGLYTMKAGPQPVSGELKRLRNDEDYATYLRVWDLRSQGKTFVDIATQEFPKEMKVVRRHNPAVDRVRAQYKRACELMKWAAEK